MDYKPRNFLKNGHFNTVYPTLFRKQNPPPYERVRIFTKDNDFLDIDVLRNNKKKLAILCHGLEGSSLSKYIIGTGEVLVEKGWDIAAMNYRGCSGEMNKNLIMYHSGATYDLDEVFNYFEEDYEEVILVGFSLGGNLCLKYVGERGLTQNHKISKVTAVSVPVDLEAGSINISKRANYIYQKRFIQSLSKKVKDKHALFPNDIDLSKLKKTKTLFDFDDLFTAPIHGFRDAKDYYAQSNSLQFLKNIKIPALIINALDDPFLPKECYPFEEVACNEYLELITPRYGGHVGFAQYGKKNYWVEKKIADFAQECTGRNINN